MTNDPEEYLDWYDIINEVYNGKVDGHKCPKCQDGALEVQADPEDPMIRLTCQSCGKFVEIETRLGH
ncbi:MAG TPA: hypothetical protein VG389_00185 [Myxococcota bacterium]|nr:hypothetical protein [Myxococcota bacterium]